MPTPTIFTPKSSAERPQGRRSAFAESAPARPPEGGAAENSSRAAANRQPPLPREGGWGEGTGECAPARPPEGGARPSAATASPGDGSAQAVAGAAGPKIGLALGSGSARGWAHVGVIRELEAAGYRPQFVCGASIGALVGAAYADGDLDEFERWVLGLDWKSVLAFFDIGFSGGLIRGDKLTGFFTERFVGKRFPELPLPFACVATDLASGREVWLREGGVAEAVRASIAIPGLLAPQRRDGALLVDGGLVNPVPVSLCRAMGAEIVIAVDLGTGRIGRRHKLRRKERTQRAGGWNGRLREWLGGGPADANGVDDMPSMLDVLATSLNIMQGRIACSRLAGEPADLVIAPRVAQVGLLDFHRGEEAIAEGAEATRLMMPLLARMMEDA